jgi:3-isopropylmalate/(R)-2-methylmalate dehydratase large subunit
MLQMVMRSSMESSSITGPSISGATYCAMEFEGPVIDELSIEERMTICNMAIEAGGKNGVIAADAKVEAYVKERTDVPYTLFKADADADYKDVYVINCTELEPTVAIPSAPDKRKGVSEIKGTELTRAYIGSCTGGKTEDFAAAAEIMYGQKVAMDTFVVPSTTFVEIQLNTLKHKAYVSINRSYYSCSK